MLRLSPRFVAIRSAAASPVGERRIDAPPLASPPPPITPRGDNFLCLETRLKKQTMRRNPNSPDLKNVLIQSTHFRGKSKIA